MATTAADHGRAAHRSEVITVYAIGLCQGLSLVAFPAAAIVLTSAAGYGLPESRYGLLFLPQVVMAIAGSLALPALARRFRLKQVLLAGLVANSIAMGLLAGSYPLHSDAAAYPMLLLATAALGLGFGLTLGPISTYAGAFMPGRRAVALTALNVLLGLGTALSPFLIAIFTDLGRWWYLPLLAAAGLVVLIVAAVIQPMSVPGVGGRPGRARVPGLFWLFAAALVCYGVAETMFGNWGTTLLVGRGIKPAVGQRGAGRVLGGGHPRQAGDRTAVGQDPFDSHVRRAAVGHRRCPAAGSGRAQRGRRHRPVCLRRPGLLGVLPDDRRLRRVDVPEHR